MKLKIFLGIRHPKGYTSTEINFSEPKTAEKWVDSLNNKFLLTKAQMLKYPLSKRKEKLIKFAKQKKYCLTKEGKHNYLLWEEII